METEVQNQLKGILSDNNIAFVIGNGINLHFFEDVKSWIQLLESLWNNNYQNNSCEIQWNEFFDKTTNKLHGISMTELFDLIELNANDKFFINNSNILNSVKNQKEFHIKEGLKEHSRLTKDYFQLSNELKEICRSWCQNNLKDSNTLTDIDCIVTFSEFLSNNTKVNLYKNILKKEIVNEYNNVKCSNDFNSFMKIIEAKRVPVLTTNFDTYMSASLNLKKHKMGNSFSDYYPWNIYFSDNQLQSPVSGFGIWHINGMVNYHRSIKIGLSDYMNCVTKARDLIHFKNINDYFDGTNRDNWAGCNTWLSIIFNRPLFIFGLSLDENEVFLRWLLIQRAKYSKMYRQQLDGWYVDKDISNGKRAFLKALGFNVISADYEDLYNSFYQSRS